MDLDSPVLVLAPSNASANRRRPLTRLCALLLAVQLPVALGAIVVRQGDGEVVADGALAAAADRTEAATSLRFEGLMSIHGDGLDLTDVPLMYGEEAGGLSHIVIDPAAMLEATGEGAGETGGLEMFQDATVLYIRAPLFASFAANRLPVPPELEPLASLGDRWGRVDLTTVAASAPSEISALMQVEAVDLASSLDLIRRAAGDAEELGDGEVRGVAVTRYGATLTLAEMLESQGGDLEMMEGLLPPALPGGPDPVAILEALSAVELDLEVAIDEAGLVRRVAFAFGHDFLVAVAEEIGEDASDVPDDISFGMAIEVFDVNDPAIVVALPDAPDAVDLTPWALGLAGGTG